MHYILRMYAWRLYIGMEGVCVCVCSVYTSVSCGI